METKNEIIRCTNNQIAVSNQIICRHISNVNNLGRGEVSQDILSELRTFVEHIILRIYIDYYDVERYNYDSIRVAIKMIRSIKKKNNVDFNRKIKNLYRFHSFLQISVSHYSYDPENSERLMQKYYEYLFDTRKFIKERYNISVLENIEGYPTNTDRQISEYYEKVANVLENDSPIPDTSLQKKDKYYIHKIKPFFVNKKRYYMITMSQAINNRNKHNRIIAFTKIKLTKNYAVSISYRESSITLMDINMPIIVIEDWKVAIRPIEIQRFSEIFGKKISGYTDSAEYRFLMEYLTETGYNLVDILLFPDEEYDEFKFELKNRYNARVNHLEEIFQKCRQLLHSNAAGVNILRYILFHMNDEIIKYQISTKSNSSLSNLYLQYGCIPFDDMPFCSSPLRHNPSIVDLLECIDYSNRNHEFFARHIIINSERKGIMYTSEDELMQYGDAKSLQKQFNNNLYKSERQQSRCIDYNHNCYYIRGHQKNTVEIIKILDNMSSSGVVGYANTAQVEMDKFNFDCEEKRAYLLNMFTNSHIALIYGSAGTGKTYIIEKISRLFGGQKMLYLANTHTAVGNLERRVTKGENNDFMTISSFLSSANKKIEYDIMFIDECSSVSNQKMLEVLKKCKFKIIVLSGDIYQIESIEFGNWFALAKYLVNEAAIYELKTAHRSRKNTKLQNLWNNVRENNKNILEIMSKENYSSRLDSTIYRKSDDDEILLCLNYDGLYGINNINRILQESNPAEAVPWGIYQYKKGDPIIFNDSERFSPIIYNNVRGKIVNVVVKNNKIQYDIEVYKAINALQVSNLELEILYETKNKHTVIRFYVDTPLLVDDNRETPASAVVPFQVAYAVSIHKAQGLEYESVKLVITNETGEYILHNIFYTAITRTTNKLKIYWSPEVENEVIKSLKLNNYNKEIQFISQQLVAKNI